MQNIMSKLNKWSDKKNLQELYAKYERMILNKENIGKGLKKKEKHAEVYELSSIYLN